MPTFAAATLVLLLAQFPETRATRVRRDCHDHATGPRGTDEAQVQACLARELTRAEEKDRQEAMEREASDRAYRESQAAHEAEIERERAQVAADNDRAARENAVLRKKCGKDYHRLRVGMAFSRVRRCSGLTDFAVVGQDERWTEYEAQGGFIWVEKGIVTRWIAPR